MRSQSEVWLRIPNNPYNTFVELAREIALRSEGKVNVEAAQCLLSRALRGTLPRKARKTLIYECLLAKTGNEPLALRLYGGILGETMKRSVEAGGLVAGLTALASNPLLRSLLAVIGTFGDCTEEEIGRLVTIAMAAKQPLKISTFSTILKDLRGEEAKGLLQTDFQDN